MVCISLSNLQNESITSCFVNNLSWSINIYLEKKDQFLFNIAFSLVFIHLTCVKRNANCSFFANQLFFVRTSVNNASFRHFSTKNYGGTCIRNRTCLVTVKIWFLGTRPLSVKFGCELFSQM